MTVIGRVRRAHIAFIHDLVMAATSFVAALYLRLGDDLFGYSAEFMLQGTALFTLAAAGAFLWMRLYRGVWRYASLNDMIAIAKSATLAVLIFLPLMFLLTRLEDLPRSILVINWFVLVALLGGPRILYRLFKDRRFSLTLERDGLRRVPVLLVGAGDGAELFLRAMAHRPTAHYRVVGIVDEKGTRVGRKIHGVDVLADLETIPAAIKDLTRRGQRPERLIITKDDLDGASIRSLLEVAEEHGLTLCRLPRLTDFKSGIKEGLEFKPLNIEDLLRRPQMVLDRASMKAMIASRRIMVTGAGGTIGGELVRQISDFEPAHISLLENSEFNLYAIERELEKRHPGLSRTIVLCDVRHRARLDEVMAAERPDLVFHAAALKQVPMVEANPNEGVLTNVVGTRHVADACRAAKVEAMVLISTDKAVNPTSVMGAAKRVAESYCQALDVVESAGVGGTRYVTVRFGNVLGSTGSVVPLFQRQLAAGGPLTVTHPDVMRYFMTTREAVQLVLQASALGCRGVDRGGRIFVLDMGEPVRIQSLAKHMILLAGLRPDVDIKIEYTGLRPGEKMVEELFHPAEPPMPTECEGILLAPPRSGDYAALARAIDELAEASGAGRTDETLALLRRLVPEYNPAGETTPRAAVASG